MSELPLPDPRACATPDEAAARLAGAMAAHGLGGAELALVLGSGLGALAERIEDARELSFEELPDLPASRVPGHAGRFVRGTLGGVPVLAQQGRAHLYEGWSARELTRSVRAFARLGARVLVLTNAAGGLVPRWAPPCLMRIDDHLNLQGVTPLARAEVGRGTPYDPELGELLAQAALEAGVELHAGVYAGLRGPSYETPAEVRLLRRNGAGAVGMSTVAEALAGHAAGLRVVAVSCITNFAAGIQPEPLSHEEVVAAGREIAPDFARFLEAAAPGLAVAARA